MEVKSKNTEDVPGTTPGTEKQVVNPEQGTETSLTPKIDEETSQGSDEIQDERVKSLFDKLDTILIAIEGISERLKALEETPAKAGNPVLKEKSKTSIPVFEAAAKYEVAKNKNFRDLSDLSIKYSEGMDVTHLGESRLAPLIANGLVVKSK